MTARTNRRWLLAERPTGMIEDRHFRWVRGAGPRAPGRRRDPGAQRLSLARPDAARLDLARHVPARGRPRRGGAIRRGRARRAVPQSRLRRGRPRSGARRLAGLRADRGDRAAAPTKLPPGVPIPLAMSALGLTGLTAYFGLLDVGKPAAGETVVVSGAAGATGSIAGQIARIKGCRAIGIAGGKAKCDWLVKQARFDAAIDYKSEDVGARLKELCPKGIDVYFDNVGGDILDLALARLAMRGRIVLCGAIAALQRRPAAARTEELLEPDHQARAHGGLPGLRLHEARAGGGDGALRLDPGRPDGQSGRRDGGHSRTRRPPCAACSRARTRASSCSRSRTEARDRGPALGAGSATESARAREPGLGDSPR